MVSWVSPIPIQNIGKVEFDSSENLSENVKSDGIYVVFQNVEENQIFVYDQKTKGFVSNQNIKSSQIYESLTRKTGYKICSANSLILSSALLSHFDFLKVNQKNGLLEQIEGLLMSSTPENSEKYTLSESGGNKQGINEIIPKVYKLLKDESFKGVHDWDELVKNTYFIEDINIVRKEIIYTISLIHRKGNELYLTAFQYDIVTNHIISFRSYENLRNWETLQSLILPIEDSYLKYMSKAQTESKKIAWIGWALISSEYIQFIHDDKYDFLEISLYDETQHIVHASKLSETFFLLFLDNGMIFLLSIESRLAFNFNIEAYKKGKSENYGVSFDIYQLNDQKLDLIHVSEVALGNSKSFKFIL